MTHIEFSSLSHRKIRMNSGLQDNKSKNAKKEKTKFVKSKGIIIGLHRSSSPWYMSRTFLTDIQLWG